LLLKDDEDTGKELATNCSKNSAVGLALGASLLVVGFELGIVLDSHIGSLPRAHRR
jgi:hypothetical protein